MKRIFFLLLLIVLLSGQGLFAQTVTKSTFLEYYKGKRYYIHVVDRNETLEAISQAYGVPVAEIREINTNLKDGLKPDMIIRIPYYEGTAVPATARTTTTTTSTNERLNVKTHRVQPKETWYGIARMYNISITELQSANPGIKDLKIGETLLIPSKGQPVAPAPAPERATQPAPAPAAASKPAVTPRQEQMPQGRNPVSGTILHKAKAQETVYSLARRYNTSMDRLYELNPELADGLKTGQVIFVPDPKIPGSVVVDSQKYIEHRVVQGETLSSISRKYNVPVSDITAANPGIDPNLQVGQIVKVPATEEVVSKTPVGGLFPCTPSKDFNTVYKVAYLLPLDLWGSDRIDTTSRKNIKGLSEYRTFDFIEFYEATLLALENMRDKGMNIQAYMHDVDFSTGTSKTQTVLNDPAMRDIDLIIGPLFPNSFSLAAEFAKTHGIPIVNPLTLNESVINNNPMVFKVQPSNMGNYEAFVEFLEKNHKNSKIVFVRRNGSDLLDEYRAFSQVLDRKGNIRYTEMMFSDLTSGQLEPLLDKDLNNIIIPLSDNRSFVQSVVKKMVELQPSYTQMLVGMPQWDDMMGLRSEDMSLLNMHYLRNKYIDDSQGDVSNFRNRFRSRFGVTPSIARFAYVGYDVTNYFLDGLFNYGKEFYKCTNMPPAQGIRYSFSFERSDNGGYNNNPRVVQKVTAGSMYQVN